MSDKSEDKENATIKIYNQKHNSLKNKMGMRPQTNEDGHINPDHIEEAEGLVLEICKTGEDAIGKTLEILSNVWNEMQTLPSSPQRQEKSEEIFTLAHEIKDIGSLCGYTLSAYFAESLRDYIAETALNLKNQKIIIQAHIDAMNAVHKAGIKEDAGPAAEELKTMVKVAIEKYR